MNDVRLAARSLRRSPGFLAVALVTMAIGIGVSTALFSVVDGVLLRPLPYPHADRLVALYTTNVARHQTTGAVSYADFADWRAQSRSFDAMAAGVGIAIGLVASALLTRLMAALLFGVGPRDPVTFALVAVALFAIALAAAALPAGQAARIDPASALRHE